jgi:hypothetical protein
MESTKSGDLLQQFNTRHDQFMRTYPALVVERPVQATAPPSSIPVSPKPVLPILTIQSISPGIAQAFCTGHKAVASLIDILISKYDMVRMGKMQLRRIDPRGVKLTWGDLYTNSNDSNSRLLINLGDLLSCGFSLTDVVASMGSGQCSYDQLKALLDFNPADLAISQERFHLAHLVQYFKINWEHLLVDFSVGVSDYFDDLNLDLTNIASIGISMETAMDWPKYYDEAYRKRGQIAPIHKSGQSGRVVKARQALTRDNLVNRFEKRSNGHYKREKPEDWKIYISLTLDHLKAMRVTYRDVEKWWLLPHRLSLDQFLALFDPVAQDVADYFRNSSTSSRSRNGHYDYGSRPSVSPSVSSNANMQWLTRTSSLLDKW